MKKPIDHNSIPKEITIFGRKIKTLLSHNLESKYGEARYGANEIQVNTRVSGTEITKEENKLTYIHEMMHFILNFTGYERVLSDKVDIEQFIELMSAGIYQYEESRKF